MLGFVVTTKAKGPQGRMWTLPNLASCKAGKPLDIFLVSHNPKKGTPEVPGPKRYEAHGPLETPRNPQKKGRSRVKSTTTGRCPVTTADVNLTANKELLFSQGTGCRPSGATKNGTQQLQPVSTGRHMFGTQMGVS